MIDLNEIFGIVFSMKLIFEHTNLIVHIFVIRFAISVGSQNAKGIHLRRGVLNKPEEFNVTIQPVFLMDKKYGMIYDKRYLKL